MPLEVDTTVALCQDKLKAGSAAVVAAAPSVPDIWTKLGNLVRPQGVTLAAMRNVAG